MREEATLPQGFSARSWTLASSYWLGGLLALASLLLLLWSNDGELLPRGRVRLDPDEDSALLPGCDPGKTVDPLTVRYSRREYNRFAKSQAQAERALFGGEFVGHYEEWIPRVGVNGILDYLEKEDPACHAVAHSLGHAAARVNCGLGKLLAACGARCASGCFHGVLMGLMSDVLQPPGAAQAGDTSAGASDGSGGGAEGLGEGKEGEEGGQAGSGPGSTVAVGGAAGGVVGMWIAGGGAPLRNLCARAEQETGMLEGDCLHGVGHALLGLAGPSNGEEAAHWCVQVFPATATPLYPFSGKGAQHYCGTGVWMEAMKVAGWSNSTSPCDKTRLAGACFMYRWRWWQEFRGDDVVAWGASKVATCLGMGEGARAMGCVYGLAAHVAEEVVIRGSADKVAGAVRVAKRLCDGEEVRSVPWGATWACVNGLVLRSRKYFPPGAVEAVCNELPHMRAACLATAERGMYSMQTDFAKYIFP